MDTQAGACFGNARWSSPILLIALTLVGVLILLSMAWSSHRGAVRKARTESFYDLQSAVTSFEAVYNAAPVGYQDLDIDGTIARVNPKECSLRGLHAEEMVGKPCWALFPDPHQKRI